MDLSNASILLTGGSLGIGKETARTLVQAGAKVVMTGRNPERVAAAAAETGAIAVTANVADPADVARTYTEFFEHCDRLDCLINNAGIGVFPELADVTLEDFQQVYAVNVFGAALMAQKAAEIFKEQNKGNIVNIGSTASLKGFARGTVYASSKFALRGMTECWQAELRKHNVRVFQVNPSEVATAFANPERVERTAADNKLRPQEIAHTIKALLEMDDRGFVPEHAVWATNPWDV